MITYEISDRYIDAGDASALLYAPLDIELTYRDLTYRKPRRYLFELEDIGSESQDSLEKFAQNHAHLSISG